MRETNGLMEVRCMEAAPISRTFSPGKLNQSQQRNQPKVEGGQRGTFSNHSIGLVRADLKCIHPSIKGAPIHIVSDNLPPPTFGQCPNSNWTPSPHSTGHSGALSFGPYFTILKGWIVLLISTPNHLGKRLAPKTRICPFELGQFFYK